MPAIVNTAANLLLGASMALVTRRSQAVRQELLSWPLLLLLAFEAAVVTPVATYLFRFNPQWSLLYGFDPQIFPMFARAVGWLSLVAILLNFVAVGGAFLLARAGLLTGQRWFYLAPLACGGAVILYVLVRYPDRLVLIGEYDAFWHGEAVLFLRRLAGWLGLLMYGAGVSLVVWVHRRYGDRDPQPL
ncbi:MAG: hypothetical protein AAB426_08775 [Myxococcota bacterium]